MYIPRRRGDGQVQDHIPLGTGYSARLIYEVSIAWSGDLLHGVQDDESLANEGDEDLFMWFKTLTLQRIDTTSCPAL